MRSQRLEILRAPKHSRTSRAPFCSPQKGRDSKTLNGIGDPDGADQLGAVSRLFRCRYDSVIGKTTAGIEDRRFRASWTAAKTRPVSRPVMHRWS